MNLNKVFYAGHITHTPELRYAPDGGAVAKFTVAYNEKWNDRKTNEKKEEVCFLDCVFFGKDAENVKQYLTGGAGVLVEGKLRQENWTDKDSGKKRSKHTLVGFRWQFTDAKPEGEPTQRVVRDVPQPAEAAMETDDELPF